MATDNLLRTYGDTSIKEDVLDMIENLSPEEDSLFKALGKSTAYNMVHQWLVDTLATTAAVGEEAAAFSGSALNNPTRSTNIVEIINLDFGVTDAQRAVDHYGFEDRFAYEQEKALKSWRNKAESDVLRSSLVSGASGTAAQMIGIINCVSTNKTSHTSGTVFSQSILDGLLSLAWENGDGTAVSDLFVGAVMKRKISGFSGRSGTQFVIPAASEQLITTTSGYVSDFGDLKVHLHRYMQKDYSANADATARVLGIVRDKFKIAYLNGMTPSVERFGRRGSTTDARASGACTVESLNERTSFFSDGFLLSA
jgi:hypothetical protein